MDINFMEKSKMSINKQKTGKFYISCKEKLKETGNTNEWLHILSELKPTNFKDKNKVLLGILEKHRHVVVKIGPSETLRKEFNYGRMLYKRVPGYINFICFFECEDDYSLYPNNTKPYLCENGTFSSDLMKILVMEYYPLGNFLHFPWNNLNLKSCLKQIVLSYLQAFIQFRFIHNDSHLQNILLKRTKKEFIDYTINNTSFSVPSNGLKIVIMDMENSLSGNNLADFSFVYRYIARIFADLTYNTSLKLNSINCVDIFTYLNNFLIKEGTPCANSNLSGLKPELILNNVFELIDALNCFK
jgi:hypothetical protein